MYKKFNSYANNKVIEIMGHNTLLLKTVLLQLNSIMKCCSLFG
jgi:hypothetical protein